MFPSYSTGDTTHRKSVISAEHAAQELIAAGLVPNEAEMTKNVRSGGLGRHTMDIDHPIIKKVNLNRQTTTWRASVREVAPGNLGSGRSPVFEVTPELKALESVANVKARYDHDNVYAYEVGDQNGLNRLVKAIQAIK